MKRGPRGTALPETAVMLGTVLTLLFGLAQLSLLGYTQLSADGAAYVAAHASVLGRDPSAAIASPFPHIAANGTLTVQPNAPDPTDVAVDYQLANQNSRFGGVQVVRPAHTQATVTDAASFAPFGLGIGGATLGAAAIEANMEVSAPGYNLAGAGLNTSTTYSGQKSYFSDDGNAPPYFIGMRFIWECRQLGTQTCASPQYAGLGSAEYLDADNWGAANNGIGPNAVYAAMSLHYETYATLASYLNGTEKLNPQGTSPDSLCLQRIQGWDTVPPAPTTNPLQYPLNPLGTSPSC